MLKVYGLEDYTTYYFGQSSLVNNNNSYYSFYNYNYGNPGQSCIPVSAEFIDNGKFSLEITENKEALSNAKSVYVHPSCSIPRTHIAQKYKKSTNPWLADVVVIPSLGDVHIPLQYRMIFVNEEQHIVFIVNIDNEDVRGKMSSFVKGTPFRIITEHSDYQVQSLFEQYSRGISTDTLLNAQLDYCGMTGVFDKNTQYILDIIINGIPKSKLVFEKTILATLANDDNKPTFESLSSIYEMLRSNDDDSVFSALKALSSMDYTSCPNSIKYILDDTYWNFRGNKACSSTAVKYMFKSLLGTNYFRRIAFQDNFITADDYELFHKLVKLINPEMNEQGVCNYLRQFAFMYMDAELVMHPRLKT